MADYGYLFIAGASRSGTTLIMNLLDGHPQVLVFPLEHKVFQRYFTKSEDERRTYFPETFVRKRTEGQQSVVANADLYQAYRERIKRDFGTEFKLDIDHEQFLNRYQTFLREGPVTIERIFDALTEGLVAGNAHASSIYPGLKFVVFKDPFTTEFFARQAAELMPSAKFLHIVRDPYARYCSEKKRMLRKGRLLRREVVSRINFQDFVTGLAEKAIASLQVGLENQRVLGRSRYSIIRFEDLVQSPRETLGEVVEGLDIPFDEALMSPSKLGQPITSGSSFSPTRTIDAKTTDRRRTHFYEMTSPSERDLYHRCLSLSEYRQFYELMEPESANQRMLGWLPAFKGERVRDYIWRIATGKGWMGRSRQRAAHRLKSRLPQLYLSDRLG